TPDLRSLPRIGERATGAAVVTSRRSPLPTAIRWQKAGHLRVDTDPVPQRNYCAQELVLCGRLRLRQEREANRDRRSSRPQELWPRQTACGVGGSAEGSPRRLYRLGRVRTESEAACSQQLCQGGRCEVGTRRTRAVGWAALLWTLWAPFDGKLFRALTRTTRLSL